MVPFCSRITDGRFQFDGRQIQLPPNNPPGKHAIHGQGFQGCWQLLEQLENSLTLAFTHEPAAWPWHYTVELTATLIRRQLEINVCVANRSTQSMPLGVGLHPFFPRTPRMIVSALTTHQLMLDDEGLPIAISEIPNELNMQPPMALANLVLDHVFLGWNGRTNLFWPEHKTSLCLSAAKSSRGLVVWAPANEKFVCIEPVTNLPDAFNHADQPFGGFEVLAAGQKFCASWRLSPKFED